MIRFALEIESNVFIITAFVFIDREATRGET